MQMKKKGGHIRGVGGQSANRDGVHGVIHLEYMEDEEGAGQDGQTPNDPPQGGGPGLKGCTPRSDHLCMLHRIVIIIILYFYFY